MNRRRSLLDVRAEGLKARGKKAVIIAMLGLTGVALSVYKFFKLKTCGEPK